MGLLVTTTESIDIDIEKCSCGKEVDVDCHHVYDYI